eukprot:TRINITY_DN4116_c0_g1_i4.p1 TRINITY_DN4116_c0_g1~~TRINITY_DN4116_c0_g1_i4.p1  ORF type:complete len:210 (-),score=44.84 TRINITY_DN4116_c0_g1_i4:298-927(-)
MNYTSTSPNDWNIAGFTNTSMSEDNMMRQWMYQSCVEFGYFQTAPVEMPLRSRRVDLAYHLEVCARLFSAPLRPDTAEINISRGGKGIGGTQILFTNGLADPWKELSILDDAPFDGRVRAVTMEGEAHCANWRPSEHDSKAVSAARQAERDIISKYTSASTTNNGQKSPGGSYSGWVGMLIVMVALLALCCAAGAGVAVAKIKAPRLPL